MRLPSIVKEKISTKGFAVINDVFTGVEVDRLLQSISMTDSSVANFRKTSELFAIRQFLKEVPGCIGLIFNQRLIKIISTIFGEDYFVVKSIYFDKPAISNWFVSYHQDLTISVDKKIDTDGFGPWTVKYNQFAVQPPLKILQDNFTIRIHLDKTTEANGALHVIPGSHLKEVYRPETIEWANETENVCPVERGGIMLMKPLLLHSSARTSNNNQRRVIHIEFSRSGLPGDLKWSEYLDLKALNLRLPLSKK